MELIIMLTIAVFVLSYRSQNGESVYTFIITTVSEIYNKFAPYSYQEVRTKSKELGTEYTPKEYMVQVKILSFSREKHTSLYCLLYITYQKERKKPELP